MYITHFEKFHSVNIWTVYYTLIAYYELFDAFAICIFCSYFFISVCSVPLSIVFMEKIFRDLAVFLVSTNCFFFITNVLEWNCWC
uniref:Uncharacterized protein n=1 Tax=Ascaris lumbricoides TaxID=6252 RepID=A0A0M3IQD9_ASCLU